MMSLGELERSHEEFARRNAHVVVVAVEGLEDAKQTQTKFPHLLVLADQGHGLSDAAGRIHLHAAPDGSDIDMPTTILVDRKGTVRWLYRSAVIARLSPAEVLQVSYSPSLIPRTKWATYP